MMSSDWFYPSNYIERPCEPQESIAETVDFDNIEFLNCTVNETTSYNRGKILRCLARTIALIAIGILVAPLGILWHGLCIAYHLFTYFQTDKDTSQWEKVVKHAGCFFADLRIALCIGLPWYLIYQRSFNGKESSRLFYLLACMPIILASSPQKAVIAFAPKEERVPLLKSLFLRNDYGIVPKNGGLLPYDIKKDQEDFDQLKGSFFTAQKAAAEHLLQTINKISCELPSNLNFHFDYPPNVPKMVKLLEQWRYFKCLEEPLCEIWIAELESAEAIFAFSQYGILNCFRIKEDRFWGLLTPLVNTPSLNLRFPIGQDNARPYFTRQKQERSEDAWKIKVKNSFLTIQKLQREGWPNETPENLASFKNYDPFPALAEFQKILVQFTKTSSPEDLLEHPTQETLNAQFGKKANIVHEDKLKLVLEKLSPKPSPQLEAAIKGQAKEILSCLQKAKEVLGKKLLPSSGASPKNDEAPLQAPEEVD